VIISCLRIGSEVINTNGVNQKGKKITGS